MEEDKKELASILVHAASLFGFVTNLIAIITIGMSVNLHSSFGILCAALAANNSVVLIVNSVWYFMPDTEIFSAGSNLSRCTGMIGLIFWIVGIRFHWLISINRLIAIMFPFNSHTFIRSRYTSIAVVFVLILTLVQCSPLIFVDDLWFCYDRSTMRWGFAPTETGRFFEAYCIYVPIAIEICIVILLDLITLFNLRSTNTKNANSLSQVVSSDSRKAEIRLFKQAFSQSIPLLATYIFFVFVTRMFDDNFGKFVSTTLVWHIVHGIDGLIIDLFHTRPNIFKKQPSRIVQSLEMTTGYNFTSEVR